MNVIFLGKTFEQIDNDKHLLTFKSADIPILEISVGFYQINFFTKIDGASQMPFDIHSNSLAKPSKQQDLIQKLLDENTNNFILHLSKTRNHCSKLVEGYSSIINGLELFV